MKQAFCLFIAVVFLFGAVVVHGHAGHHATLVDVNCSDASSISFSIDIPDFDEWVNTNEERSWSLNNVSDEACQPTFDQDTELVTYSNINVATCAPGDPATTPDNRTFEYEFVISVDAEADSGSTPVTFAYDHHYVVTCFYNREQKNVASSFQPRHSLTDNNSTAGDEFVIAFTVHLVENDNEVDSSSMIDLSTPVYGKIIITDDSGIPQNLDVHLRNVTADTNDSPGGDEFTLIEDGCAKSKVVTSTSCDTDSEDRFYFKIFRFPGQTGDAKVYLRAKVIVCLSSNTGSVCHSECDACRAKRKRRDTLEQVQQREFSVTAGPFQIREPDQGSKAAADKDEGTPQLPTYVIVVVAVCGLLAVAIVSAVVLIVFRRRRQNVAIVELKSA